MDFLVQAGREEDRLRVARALVRVQVTDVNDNSPVFVGLPYYAAVQVEAEPGTAIFQVTAVDRDKGQNGEVNYFLQDELGHFEMDRLSGELRLQRAFEADLSSVEYQVLVFARDMGNTASFLFSHLSRHCGKQSNASVRPTILLCESERRHTNMDSNSGNKRQQPRRPECPLHNHAR